jgi:hypothetical protein
VALELFSIESLAEFKGGLVARMLRAQTNRVALDLETAPDIGDWRKVVMTLRFKPVMEDGELADVITEVEVAGKMPARVTSARMRVRKDRTGAKQLFFEMDAPDNPDQISLFDAAESVVKEV